MQIEVNKKTIITVLAVVAVGVIFYLGYYAINKKISREGGEIRKGMTDKADKKDIAEMTTNLEAQISQLDAKMAEMNKQMTTTQTTTPASATTVSGTTPVNESTGTTTTTTTATSDSSEAEEEFLEELGEDIDDMKEIQEEAVNMLDDINGSIEDLTGAVEDVAGSAESAASDLNTLVGMATQLQLQAQTMSQQAQQTISQYEEQVVANQNILTAREELLGATKSGNSEAISVAENKLVATLNTNGSQISPAFAQQYFKQMPASFGKINGMDSAIKNVNTLGFKLDTSKLQFTKPSLNTGTGISRDSVRR